jgi:Stress responsive A/B Barrel Domain
MAIQHLVLIRFHATVSAARIQHHLSAMQSLRIAIPGILALTAGTNFSERAQGYTHAAVVTLADRAALAAYIAHPVHVEVATGLRGDSEYLVVDYEA